MDLPLMLKQSRLLGALGPLPQSNQARDQSPQEEDTGGLWNIANDRGRQSSLNLTARCANERYDVVGRQRILCIRG